MKKSQKTGVMKFRESMRRLSQREETLDKKIAGVESKEEQVNKHLKDVARRKEDIDHTFKQQIEQLEKISSMTTDEAKELLLEKVEQETRRDMAVYVREIENKAKDEAEKSPERSLPMQYKNTRPDLVAENTVSVVSLPSDEMKGRIIGREGRNIRALETATGIDLIIDDTPEAVILSGFDPIRRETARIALEKLIIDGRIHPARIEEMVKKARKEVEKEIRDAGEQAAFDVGIHNLHPEIIKLLGRLKYRTSYGQNVLNTRLKSRTYRRSWHQNSAPT